MMIHRGAQLMGANEIENLQRALNNLGIATQRPAVTCKVTGVVDDATMLAINAALGLLTEELPTWLYVGVQGALIFGISNSTAKQYIGQYATQLTLAANTAAVKFKTQPVQTPPVVVGVAAEWYKTPLGIALIAGGVLAAYVLFIKPRGEVRAAA